MVRAGPFMRMESFEPPNSAAQQNPSTSSCLHPLAPRSSWVLVMLTKAWLFVPVSSTSSHEFQPCDSRRFDQLRPRYYRRRDFWCWSFWIKGKRSSKAASSHIFTNTMRVECLDTRVDFSSKFSRRTKCVGVQRFPIPVPTWGEWNNGLFLHERIRLNRILFTETTVEVWPVFE
jgi:hypothetical protein